MITTKNPSSIKLYLFLILIFSQLILNTHSRCYIHPNPLSRERIWDDCPMVEDKVQAASTTTDPTVGTSTNMFAVTFSCGVSDPVICNKVRIAFETAGEIISSTLTLNTVINVNATFTDFCVQSGDCTTKTGFVTLGGASPARTIILQDDDGAARLYPQALVKQFQFPNHPQFSQFDILALFNSVGSKYWFQGDPEITPDQQDFLYVVLHEMIHGLGFSSNWVNDFSDGMTPDPTLNGVSANSPVAFLGFFESAFDKYMINIPKGSRISDLTDQLNKFSGSPISLNSGLQFKNQDDFVNAFTSSPSYKLAQNMLTLSTTPNSLGFLPHDANKADDSIVLETSLTPFQPGSSVSHVDYKTYNNTSDFLMKFLADRGTDLNTLITIRSADKTDQNDLRLAISSKLILLLETLGYTTPNHPNPYKPSVDIVSNSLNTTDNSIQPGSTTTTNTDSASNTKSDSMIIKPNLILTFTLIILSISMKSKYWP